MILSGDDLTKIATERLGMLKRLLPPNGVAARFEDESMQVGMMELEDARTIAIFNWKNNLQSISIRLSEPFNITDFWSGESLGRQEGVFGIKDMPAHSAR